MIRFVNLTPHVVMVLGEFGELLAGIQATGEVARVEVKHSPTGECLRGVPLLVQETGEVVGLPDPEPGVWYVVSALVRLAVPERDDVLSPGPLVRDEHGRPTGCRGLVRNV